MGMQNAFGGQSSGSASVAFGTVINVLCQPRVGCFTRVTGIRVTAAGTAHALTGLRPLGRTTVASAGATGQAVVNIAADPGVAAAYGGISNAIAANDWVAIRTASDGITRLYKVSSVSVLAITMTANLTVAVAAGDLFWFFGVAADTDGRTGNAHPTLTVPASATTQYTDDTAGVVSSIGQYEPILIQDNNITATGTIENVNYAYSQV
jgi:hypothetical protein